MPANDRLEQLRAHARKQLAGGAPDGLESLLPDEATSRNIAEAALAWSEPVAKRRGFDRGAVQKTVEKIRTDAAFDLIDGDIYEAIILPAERPVADIQDDRIGALPPGAMAGLLNAGVRARVEAQLPSIGCILLPQNPRIPYVGTAFVVGRGLLMTNRHVAEAFSYGVGKRIQYVPSKAAFTTARQGPNPSDEPRVSVTRVVMVHPYWDMAVLEVPDLQAAPLTLAARPPAGRRAVAVVGYPAFDSRNDAGVQNDVFRGRFFVKRLSPGFANQTARVQSFEHEVDALTHDASTLGGNSGSAVIDLDTGNVLALHFAGRYLVNNYAVPSHQLARDRRVAALGLGFAEPGPGEDVPWDDVWRRIEPSHDEGRGAPHRPVAITATSPSGTPALAAQGELRRVSFQLPIDLDVRVGAPIVDATAPGASAAQADREEFHIDPDYDSRLGYEADFLGDHTVPLPKLHPDLMRDVSFDLSASEPDHELRYHHFSVVMNKRRRIAFFTACNTTREPSLVGDLSRTALNAKDGKAQKDKWILDPRIPAEHQIQTRELYGPLIFDRGHLTRREDVYWGEDEETAQLANFDSFHYTNCSPQHPDFNQTGGLWGELEGEIGRQATSQNLRFCIFAGPIFSSNDRVMKGVKIPSTFWKVVVGVLDDGSLGAWGFRLSQHRLVRDATEAFEPGAFADYQVPLKWIAERTRLDFGKKVLKADQLRK